MGNKKYLIFIAIVIFSAVLFSNKADAQALPECNSFEINGTCKPNNDCPVPPNTIKSYPQVAVCPVATDVCCVAPQALPTCQSLNGTCKSVTLCPVADQKQATGCIGTDICCVASAAPTLCSTAGGTCRLDCLSTEEAKSGTFADCLSGNPKCCVLKSATPAPTGTTEFPNPIICTTAQCILESLLITLQGVVAIIAIIMIVTGGIIYMFAGVNEKSVELGKKMIAGAVIGLTIIVAAPAFLKEILAILSPTDVVVDPLISAAPSLTEIAERILNLVLSIAGILGIIGLIVGGGYYMTAYGDEDRIKKGKTVITASLIGILFALAALVIVRQIAVLLG